MTCILWDGVHHRGLVGAHPVKTGPISIGYRAYPNPTLKNTIPDQQFFYFKSLQTIRELPKSDGHFKVKGKMQASVTKPQYLKKIKAIHKLLGAGEIYQLNYAIRFRQSFSGDPYALFVKWAKSSPAEFSAFLDCGKFQILSLSPERLFKFENGIIRTEPIKGTASKAGGQKSLKALLASEKERAELDMITDLERNDVGRICDYGTLKVIKNRAIKALPNLWHTYSVVEGRVSKTIRPQVIFNALFPGGSITGCPKKRAMHYIETLEKNPRNIFCGSIGYTDRGKMDFNIAIRTALIQDGVIEYWAGGGIVADSVPEKEYDECLLKAERFFSVL